MNVRLQRVLVRFSSYFGGSILASMVALSSCTDGACPKGGSTCPAPDDAKTDEQPPTTNHRPSSSETTTSSENPTSGAQPSDHVASSDTALNADTALTSDTQSSTPSDDTGQFEGYTCDQRQVTCRLQPPRCDFGFVPRVKDGCYTTCVRVDDCVCEGADACPDRNQYTCNLSRQRCTPYLN